MKPPTTEVSCSLGARSLASKKKGFAASRPLSLPQPSGRCLLTSTAFAPAAEADFCAADAAE